MSETCNTAPTEGSVGRMFACIINL